jgi:hypothetical protein
MVMKSSIFSDIMLCSLPKVNQRFRGTYCLHLHSWRISYARNNSEASSRVLLGTCFMLVPSSSMMALGSTQPLTEMSTRNLPVGKVWPPCEADNLTTICEPNVLKTWGPQHLTTLWAFTACYRGSFTFSFFYFCLSHTHLIKIHNFYKNTILHMPYIQINTRRNNLRITFATIYMHVQ